MHREVAGGATLARVRRARSLLEELAEVVANLEVRTDTRQVFHGLVIAQVRELPLAAAREAVVNGVAHRDWGTDAPTVVEHIGRTLRVTSPGGFVGGVTSDNILTHPSSSRNPSLAQLLADLRIAEREGVGVDRMVGEMIGVGHAPPTIGEIEGPYVRTTLTGDLIDTPWMHWLADLDPRTAARDVNALLVWRHIITTGWIDARRAAPLIQLPVQEVTAVLTRLADVTQRGEPVLRPIEAAPEGEPPAWALSAAARTRLQTLDAEDGKRRPWPTRRGIAASYAEARGRISTSELAALTHAAPSNMGTTLKGLEAEGLLRPSSATRRGRGFYYIWAGREHDRV